MKESGYKIKINDEMKKNQMEIEIMWSVKIWENTTEKIELKKESSNWMIGHMKFFPLPERGKRSQWQRADVMFL